jgi:hypothetical protein
MLSVAFSYSYSEYPYDECRYAECHNAEWSGATKLSKKSYKIDPCGQFCKKVYSLNLTLTPF